MTGPTIPPQPPVARRLSTSDDEFAEHRLLLRRVSREHLIQSVKTPRWWAGLSSDSIQGDADPRETGFSPKFFDFIMDLGRYLSVNQILGRGDASDGRSLKPKSIASVLETAINYHGWSANIRRGTPAAIADASEGRLGHQADLQTLKMPEDMSNRVASYVAVTLWMDYPQGQIQEVPPEKASGFANRLLKMQLVLRYVFFLQDLLYDGSPLQRRFKRDVETLSKLKALHSADFGRRQAVNSRVAPLGELIQVTKELIKATLKQIQSLLSLGNNGTQKHMVAVEICEKIGVILVINSNAAPRAIALSNMNLNGNFRPVKGVDGAVKEFACDWIPAMLKGVGFRAPSPPPLRFHQSVTTVVERYINEVRPFLVAPNCRSNDPGPLLLTGQRERVNSNWLRRSWNKWIRPQTAFKQMTPHQVGARMRVCLMVQITNPDNSRIMNQVRHAHTKAVSEISGSACVRDVARRRQSLTQQHDEHTARLHYDVGDASSEADRATDQRIDQLHAMCMSPTLNTPIPSNSIDAGADLSGLFSDCESDDSDGELFCSIFADMTDDQADPSPLSPLMEPHVWISPYPTQPGVQGSEIPPPPPRPRQPSSAVTQTAATSPHPSFSRHGEPPSKRFKSTDPSTTLPSAKASSPYQDLLLAADDLDAIMHGWTELPSPWTVGVTSGQVSSGTPRQKYSAPTDGNGRPIPPSSIPCGTCALTFLSAAGLVAHRKGCIKKHDEYAGALRNNEPVCKVCLKVFTTVNRLLQHFKSSQRCAPKPTARPLLLLDR